MSLPEMQKMLNSLLEQAASLKQQIEAQIPQGSTEASTGTTAPSTSPTDSTLPAGTKGKGKDEGGEGEDEDIVDDDDKDDEDDDDEDDNDTKRRRTAIRPNFDLNWKRPKGRKITFAEILGLTLSEKGVWWRGCKKILHKNLDMTKCMTDQALGVVMRTIRELDQEWPELSNTSDPEWLYRQLIIKTLKSSSEIARRDAGKIKRRTQKKAKSQSQPKSGTKPKPKPKPKPDPQPPQPQPPLDPEPQPQPQPQPPPDPKPQPVSSSLPATGTSQGDGSDDTGDVVNDDYDDLPDGDELLGSLSSAVLSSHLGEAAGTASDSTSGEPVTSALPSTAFNSTANNSPSATQSLAGARPTGQLTQDHSGSTERSISATDAHVPVDSNASSPPGSPSRDQSNSDSDDDDVDDVDDDPDLQAEIAAAIARVKAEAKKAKAKAKAIAKVGSKGKAKAETKKSNVTKAKNKIETIIRNTPTGGSPPDNATQIDKPERAGGLDVMDIDKSSSTSIPSLTLTNATLTPLPDSTSSKQAPFNPSTNAKRKREDEEPIAYSAPPLTTEPTAIEQPKHKRARFTIEGRPPTTPSRVVFQKNFGSPDPATPVRQSSRLIKNPHLMPASYGLSNARGPSVKPSTLGEQAASGTAPAAKNHKVKNQKSNSKKNSKKKN
ncbi:hypothetical protein FRC11_012918 [Ceratobasidium sp. 423]|nr:hypothetical protein FRC11_012918 [Ceratobasidium sp. 423]